MIKSKDDYKKYLEADRKSNCYNKKFIKRNFDAIYKYLRLLRKTEYFTNCRSDFIGKMILLITRIRLRNLSMKCGFSIPINVFGPGLSIAHLGTIVVSDNAKIGANCRIHVCVNIGASAGKKEAPIIGNNVYIAPGAKIFGNIKIADNIAIGANAVVNKSFTEKNVTIAGIPAEIISSSKGAIEAGWNPSE